jgi:hypothetical protein
MLPYLLPLPSLYHCLLLLTDVERTDSSRLLTVSCVFVQTNTGFHLFLLLIICHLLFVCFLILPFFFVVLINRLHFYASELILKKIIS